MTILCAARVAGFLFAVLVAAVGHAGGDRDHWFATSVEGQRAGYLHDKRETVVEDDQTLILTDLESRLSFKRLGRELTVSSRVRTWETPEGLAVRFSNESRLSSQSLMVEGERTADGFQIRTRAMGAAGSPAGASAGAAAWPGMDPGGGVGGSKVNGNTLIVTRRFVLLARRLMPGISGWLAPKGRTSKASAAIPLLRR